MTIPHLFLPPQDLEEDSVKIEGEKAHYLKNVLRLKRGDNLFLMDGEGGYFLAQVEEMGKETRARILERHWKQRKPPFLKVGLPILRGGKTEIALRALAQLGVHTIIPFFSVRSVTRLDGERREEKRIRWQRVVEEEAEVARYPFYPKIEGITEFPQMLEQLREEYTLFAYEEGGMPLKEALPQELPPHIALVTGPEGGFTKEEVEMAREEGAKIISLGENILRAELAPIVLAVLILYR